MQNFGSFLRCALEKAVTHIHVKQNVLGIISWGYGGQDERSGLGYLNCTVHCKKIM